MIYRNANPITYAEYVVCTAHIHGPKMSYSNDIENGASVRSCILLQSNNKTLKRAVGLNGILK